MTLPDQAEEAVALMLQQVETLGESWAVAH